ncbi:unnamed protein product [Boreogadus saida]
MHLSAWAPPTFPTGHLRALLELGPFSGLLCASCPASLAPGDGHLACFVCLGTDHAEAPVSCVACRELPEEPCGCRVAVGRRVHMASGSPASKKRRPLEPLVARARGYGRLYRSPSSPHYSVEAVGAEEYGLFLDCLPQLSARPLSDRYACWQERNVTALSTMRLLGLMAAAHPVVPLGLLFMRRLQRWFACQRLDPRRHKLRVLLVFPFGVARPGILEKTLRPSQGRPT